MADNKPLNAGEKRRIPEAEKDIYETFKDNAGKAAQAVKNAAAKVGSAASKAWGEGPTPYSENKSMYEKARKAGKAAGSR